ncbi:MAG: DNA repair protein RadA [Candidatus Limnocylindria bacterium]
MPVRSVFVCQQCGHESPKWEGQCPSCQAWNAMVETAVARSRVAVGSGAPRSSSRTAIAIAGKPVPMPIGELSSAEAARLPSSIGEVDRVLGGGFVPGSVVLFGGDPGIGKSTLLLQLAARLAAGGQRVLYVSGEESATQVRSRAERVGGVVPGLSVLATTDLEGVVEALEGSRPPPALVVVDSVQTVASPDLGGPAGSVGQVRQVAARLAELARAGATCVALVGHVTKEGTVAGPRTLEHLVDAVIYLEGERLGATRLLRAAKNRFGSTEEVGVLEMRATGLVEVRDASRFFLESEQPPVPGGAVTVAVEGSRPLLVEIQALVAPAGYGSPRRAVNGIDLNRVLMLIAVLARHAGLNLTGHDVYVNVAGGLRIDEPAVDLAAAAALASSLRGVPIRPATALAGELSLSGRLRAAGRLESRLAEAGRLGFERLVSGPPNGPPSAAPARSPHSRPELVAAGDIRSALDAALARF